MYQASLRRRGINELQEIGEVPKLWEVRLEKDEEEELVSLVCFRFFLGLG